MNLVFLNGWGIDQSSARDALNSLGCFDSVAVVQPIRPWRSLLDGVSVGEDTIIIGYSTGAFLLLEYPEIAKRFARSILLAPFVDFRLESQLGGLTRLAQLKVMSQWLQRAPKSALEDFYKRAGVSLPLPNDLPVSPADLLWGIERLSEDTRCIDSLKSFECFVGEDDPLVDASLLKRLNTHLTVLPAIGHDLIGLLRGVKDFL